MNEKELAELKQQLERERAERREADLKLRQAYLLIVRDIERRYGISPNQ